MFKITELPPQIIKKLHKKAITCKDKSVLEYSENMIVYTGRKGLHIFDIDRERWVFNSKKLGYNYQDQYYAARNIVDSSEEEGRNIENENSSSNSNSSSSDNSFLSALDDLIGPYNPDENLDSEEDNRIQSELNNIEEEKQ